tara:strand:+ start:198 stop:584 length:387 start_codon:yes stop_codon:yes gene_type:complete
MKPKTLRFFAAVEAFAILTTFVAFFLILAGCNTNGFQYLPDGFATPGSMRNAAATARAEADALDAMANRTDATIGNTIGVLEKGADIIGAPAIVGGLLGAAGTLFVPPPGTARKRRKAEDAAKGNSRK